MWKEPGSLPNTPKTWSAPLPAVGVDSGYPLQDWITFFVGIEPETRPAKCQCVRASGRRFGQEQTYNGDVLNHREVLWEYDERGLESTDPFFKYKQQVAASDGYIGCYQDDRSRDFNYGPREYGYDVDTCRAACTSYEYFALQNDGWCSCDNSYSTPPSQYPRRADRDCGKTRKGGGWANAVFAQAPGLLRRTVWVESAKSAIYGIPGLLNLTQTYGSAVNATNGSPSLPLVAQHGFGGQAPRIRAVRFLAASDIGSGEQTEAEALSARLHWSAAGAALRSSLGNSHVVDPARSRISSRGSVRNDQPGAPRRRRCHPHLFPTPAATGKMMGTSSSYEYVAYADTDCAQAPHRERDEGIIPAAAGQTSADAKVQCDGDPTCRAVACRSDGACFLSAAVRFSAMDGMTCFVRTAVEKATAATAAATEALAADPTGEKTLRASAEDAFSTCNVVPAGAGTGSSYGGGGAGIKPITEEVALGKLRNGSCSWVPLQDVGGTIFGAANGSALSCADAMRDIYDDACFATVYAELLSSSQRRAVCANMGGAGGAGASGCGFARPDCDYGE